jgi:V8-like Glu-specific endopeptidase
VRLAYPALLAAFAACSAAPLTDSAAEPILNGMSDAGNDPAVVYFMLFNKKDEYVGHCTASMITPRIALTAAHCASGLDGDTHYRILFGDGLDEDTMKPIAPLDNIERNSVKVWFDPMFSVNSLEKGHDVAMVLFDKPAPAGVKPVPFTRSRVAATLAGKKVRFVGVGLTTVTAPQWVFTKQTATAQIDKVDYTTITWAAERSQTCHGDSGGPTFVTTALGEEIVGLTSYGIGACDESDLQRVDLDIDDIVKFINDNDPQPTANCGKDGVCGWNCPDIDPDCPCVRDNRCTAACTDPDTDPDCPLYCLMDGVCTRTGCPVPDPDCGTKASGAACANKNECLGGICVIAAGAMQGVCSEMCSAGGTCPGGFTCDTALHQCQPAAGSSGGGCAVGAGGAGGPLALAVWLGAAWLARRRRGV